jgi:hypothetical protein
LSATSLAGTYRRRLRLTLRTGQATLELGGAVERLTESEYPVRLGQITSPDGAWVYMLFLTEDAGSLVACTAARLPKPTTAL